MPCRFSLNIKERVSDEVKLQQFQEIELLPLPLLYLHQIDRSQTPKVSSLQQQTKDSQPPTRPPSLPASSQTAELIATAPSSSSSRRTSQASPLLRPISTSSLNSHRSSLNSMLLSRSSSNDKRRKSGLSNTSSQLSPTDSSFQGANGSKRQSFDLNHQGSESGNGLVGIGPSSSSPIKNGSSKSSRRVSRSSNSGVQDGESSERPLSSISADTALGNVSTTVGSPNPTHEPHQNDSLDEPSSSWDDSSNRNSTSNRLSNLPIPPPLKIRDFAFSESDPRHVGARDLSIPEERLSTGYGNNSRLSSEEKEEEDEWGPDAHEHSYEDDEEFQEERSEVGLPEGCYQVIYPFEAESEHELSVSQGMKVMVVGALEGGWAIVQKILDDNGEGDRGLVPEGYLEWLGPVE